MSLSYCRLVISADSFRSFGKEFTTAVEQKQIAQQDAERAKFVVEKVSARSVRWQQGRRRAMARDLADEGLRIVKKHTHHDQPAHYLFPSNTTTSLTLPSSQAEQERQAAVIRAEGEAEAAATISKALNRAGEAFVQFRRIEASKDIGKSGVYVSRFVVIGANGFRV